ncbi:MAG: hypothetical protein JW720_07330 [Sedimentisphaerales bacterium]|nr:hypothetical protein [Sedimentisphaerales bacterium]
MRFAIKTTRARLIPAVLAVAIILAGAVIIDLMKVDPETILEDRKAIRSILLLPKDLRAFPVEEHIEPGDAFTYRQIPFRGEGRRWSLQIETCAEDLEKWKDIFTDYFEQHGTCRQSTTGHAPGGWTCFMYLLPKTRGPIRGCVRLRLTKPSGRLAIEFTDYRLTSTQRFWRTRYGSTLARFFYKIGLPIDAVTRPT